MPESANEIWVRTLAQMRATHPGLCRQWFEDIEPVGLAGGVLLVRAHSDVHRDYLQRQCRDPFNESAQFVTGRLISVRFLAPSELAPSAAPNHAIGTEPDDNSFAPGVPSGGGRAVVAPSNNGLPAANDSHALAINPDYEFENFVVGPGNRLAHAAAVAVAGNPGKAYNPYFVHGDVGLGKTHLLQAICLRLKRTRPDIRIYYTSCDGFITQFLDAVRVGEMSQFRHRFRDVDVLVIDDIHFLTKREQTQEEFFHTFNSLYQAHRQIVVSSDAPPEEITDLEERLVSRFKWGLVTSVAPPAYETRIEILKQKARLRGFELSDEVAGHIAAKIDTNIRELEGAVIKLQMLATVEVKPITLELARAAIGDDDSRPEKQTQIQTIIGAVTDFYGVKVTDLQSKKRQRSIALPRQVCMFLARRNTRYSLEEIGGYFGGRDHSTVMHAIRTVEDRIDTDPQFKDAVAALEKRVRDENT